MQVRGSHVGSYLPSSGVWHHTQRFLKKGTSDMNIVHHLDFDAPTRENANVLPDDKVLYAPLSCNSFAAITLFCTSNLYNGYANLHDLCMALQNN